MDSYERNEWIAVIATAVMVVSIIVFFFFAIISSGNRAKRHDRAQRAKCVEMGGVVVPSSDEWTCALPNGVKAER